MDILHLSRHIQLMAVIKNRNIQEILSIINKYQITLIGESRWQEAKKRLDDIPKKISKHFIGHVQSNKINNIANNFDCIESVDSIKIIDAIESIAHSKEIIYPIFLQINISNDPKKHGFSLQNINVVVNYCKTMFHVELLGLMAITARQNNEQTRKDYKILKQLQQLYGLKHLSIGMSSDWQIAVEEGATIIRLGRALFENI